LVGVWLALLTLAGRGQESEPTDKEFYGPDVPELDTPVARIIQKHHETWEAFRAKFEATTPSVLTRTMPPRARPSPGSPSSGRIAPNSTRSSPWCASIT
jgi:hypothetical protein